MTVFYLCSGVRVVYCGPFSIVSVGFWLHIRQCYTGQDRRRGAGAEMLKLLAIGEVMAEIRQAETGFAVQFAGDTYNTAIYAARALGSAQSVGYLSRVGTEPLSEALLTTATAEGLNTSWIQRCTSRNIGIYAVATDSTGERSFSYWRDSSAARLMFSDSAPVSEIPDADIIYLSGISLAILSPQSRECLFELMSARKGTSLIAFDSNYRPALWEDIKTARDITEQVWSLADIALPSIDDEMALFGDKTEQDVVARFAGKDWHRLVLKRGERGPLAPLCPEASSLTFPPAERVIDTTAAGDSFNGGYLAAMLAGADETACLMAGHQLAAEVVGAPGAITPR